MVLILILKKIGSLKLRIFEACFKITFWSLFCRRMLNRRRPNDRISDPDHAGFRETVGAAERMETEEPDGRPAGAGGTGSD